MQCLAAHQDGVRLMIHAQPKASKNRVAGFHGNALKVAVASPPVEGKANKALLEYLAKIFSLPRASIFLMSGEHSRTKVVFLKGIMLDEAQRIITAVIG